jgi:hypothetical protein
MLRAPGLVKTVLVIPALSWDQHGIAAIVPAIRMDVATV